MNLRRIKWRVSRTIYVAQTILMASFVAVGAWVVFNGDGWDMRCMFGLGAAVFAWAMQGRIRWLFSEDARHDAAPIEPGYPRSPDAP
jgi:hypothetical protein